MTRKTGGPAYPYTPTDPTRRHLESRGMTLRDYIAIHAGEEDIAEHLWTASSRRTRAAARYAHADTMLAVRESKT